MGIKQINLGKGELTLRYSRLTSPHPTRVTSGRREREREKGGGERWGERETERETETEGERE